MNASAVSSDGQRIAPSLDLRTRLAIRMGGLLLRLLGLTWRLRIHGRDDLRARAPNDARVLYTLWHGQMLPVLYGHRTPTAVMISEHRDGEIIANIVAMFEASAFRGSSSRGGARALLEGVRLLRSGTDVAITPDGPRGPRHSYAPGALLLAFRADVAICPIVAHVDRAWRLRSWDGFEIPKPFARVTVLYGARTKVDAEDAHDAATQTERFAALMQRDMARVQDLAERATVSPGAR